MKTFRKKNIHTDPDGRIHTDDRGKDVTPQPEDATKTPTGTKPINTQAKNARTDTERKKGWNELL